MSRTPPPVSVLLPVRDGAEHIDEALTSLADQEFPDFEVVVVDDGSVDGTPAILEAWSGRDARIRVVRQEAAGIVPALERARAEAQGRYLARMDADDASEPGRLTEQHALMEADPTLVLCGCGVRYFPEAEVRDGARRYQEWLNAATTPGEIERELFVECPLAHPTFFMRAEAVAAVGGYRDAGWPEDYDLLLRLWAAGGRLAQVPGRLLRWREGPERLSRTHERYAPEAFLACKVHHLRRTLLSGRPGVVVWGAGPTGKALSTALRKAGEEVVAFVEVDPRKIGREIHGAPVLDQTAGARIRGPIHLAAVGQPGARDELRATLETAGLRELSDFVAIA